VVTVVFQPNSREGAVAEGGGPNFNRFVARAGGAVGYNDVGAENGPYYTNATVPSWYSGAPDVMVVGMATQFGDADRRWRGCMRFHFNDIALDQSSIKSGPEPQLAWWQNVVAARLKFHVIGTSSETEPIPDQSSIPLTESDLRIKFTVGNGFYSPTGDEDPMGDAVEAGFTFIQILSSQYVPTLPDLFPHIILPWAELGPLTDTLVTVDLSQEVIDWYLKSALPSAWPNPGDNPFLEIGMILELDRTNEDNVNVTKVEIAAWGVNQPTLEIDFDVAIVADEGKRVSATGLPSRVQAEGLPTRAGVTALPSRAHAEALPNRVHATAIPSRVQVDG